MRRDCAAFLGQALCLRNKVEILRLQVQTENFLLLFFGSPEFMFDTSGNTKRRESQTTKGWIRQIV